MTEANGQFYRSLPITSWRIDDRPQTAGFPGQYRGYVAMLAV